MLVRAELVERRDALVTVLETVQEERTWQLMFDAYLTVCEALEESAESQVHLSQIVIADPI